MNLAGTGSGTGSKITFSTADTITGSGTLTKTGGADIYINGAQNFVGGWFINGGFVEATNATALGATNNTVTINSGQLIDNGQTLPYRLTLNAGSAVRPTIPAPGTTSPVRSPSPARRC